MTKDTDFMDELNAAMRTQPVFLSNIMLISITAFILVAVGWAAVSKVEERTRGLGQVVPTSEIQVVQSLEGGILAELLVGEGDIVEKDQILMRISDVAFASEERGVEARSDALKAKKARLEAEAQGSAFSLPDSIEKNAPQIAKNERALYKSRQQELKNAKSILNDKIARASAELSEVRAKISRLSDSKKLLKKELDMTRRMVKKRAVPELEAIRLERELGDIAGQVREAQEKRGGLEAELRAAQKEQADKDDKFRSQALGELNDVQTQLRQLEESLTAIGDRVFRAELRSPVRGVVNKVMLKTIGGVVEPAMKLAEIVPLDDTLKIMAKVAPHEIAFLHPGQDVKVKITAYDPQRYGALQGKLARIGANSVSDREGNTFFEIEVRTDKNHLGTADHPLPITPGMVAETEVITGNRTILEYLMKPILRARDRALTER